MQDISCEGRLILDGGLTVRNAAAIAVTLREAIIRHPVVSIDCTAADDVDVCFVQLLVAARKGASKAGNTVSLAARPSGPLLDALTRGGFQVTQPDPADPQSFWFEGASA